MNVGLLLVLLLTACGGDDSGPLEVPELSYSLDSHWPSRPLLPEPREGLVLVTNTLDDTVSVFELGDVGTSAFTELVRLPVGLSPAEPEGLHHAALHPSGEAFYVGLSNVVPGSATGPHGTHGTGTSDGDVVKYDAQGRRVASARVDPSPGDLVLSADGETLYVTHYDLARLAKASSTGAPASERDARLAILDARTLERKAMVPLCPAPHGMKLSADGKTLYASCYSDELAVVDLTASPPAVTRVPLPGKSDSPLDPAHLPYALTQTPDGELWVSCLEGKDLHVFSPSSGTFDGARGRLLLGVPVFGDVTPAGTVLVPSQGDDVLLFLQRSTGALERSLGLFAHGCLSPHQVKVLPSGTHALVVCEGDHRSPGSLVTVSLTGAEPSVVDVTPVGVFPDFVGVLPGGSP